MAVGVRVVVAQVVVPNEGTVDNAVIARKIRSLETCVTQGAARIVVTVHPVGPATDKAFRQHQQSARCVRKGQQTRAGEACVRIATYFVCSLMFPI